jgi:benzoyl-CoA reductase/2-hydroxyglutaryl-CoA dehydratase subunit BcrC/BadD/HgdB
MAADTIDFKSYLQMSIDFFEGPDLIEKARKEGNRKIGSLTFPFGELFIGGGVVPIFIPRLNKGKKYDTIRAAISARDILGVETLARGFDFLKTVDRSGRVLGIANTILNDVVSSLNETYETAAKESVANGGMPVDHCYGARALFGLYQKLGKNVDINLGIDLRCSVFFNFHEALSINKYVKNNYIMDSMNTGQDVASFYEAEFWEFIHFQEGITGKKFDENRFRDALEDTNEVKRLMKEIFYEIAAGDTLPCSPATFSEIQSLLVYSMIDYNSRLQRYLPNLKDLVQEMHDRIDQPSKRFEAAGMPKIMYFPMFGGFEPEIASYADELGARVYYPDWCILGACEPVKTTGKLVRNYAEMFVNFQHGCGFDNEDMARGILDIAEKMRIDGIIFNEVFGCRTMCTGHRCLKDIIRAEGKDLPVTVITFNNMGDSLGQVKTRVSALVEMLKGK